jgi:hypothetical protein
MVLVLILDVEWHHPTGALDPAPIQKLEDRQSVVEPELAGGWFGWPMINFGHRSSMSRLGVEAVS